MAYKMTHPETPDAEPIEVDADMVAMYRSQGWETAPTAKPPESTESGPVRTVLVSEEGPEFFTAKQSGRIVPNKKKK